jgi:RNA polymerase sigma-70 factor (ECF subfamily)
VTASTATPQPDDAALVARARLREPEALALLYWRHAAALLRTAYAITLVAEDAEEIVQDVFVGLSGALVGYEERGQFLSWLKRVAARRALTLLRDRRRRLRLAGMDERPVAPGTTPEGLAVRDALAALPEDLRIVVVLKEIEGYSHAEIAEIVGIRRGTAEVRLHRGLKRLRQTLEGP